MVKLGEILRETIGYLMKELGSLSTQSTMLGS